MPVLRRILVLVNPAAGRGRAHRFIPAIASLFQKHGVAAEFVSPQNATDLAGLATVGASLHDAILVMGGDGTFQHVARSALGSGTPLGMCRRLPSQEWRRDEQHPEWLAWPIPSRPEA